MIKTILELPSYSGFQKSEVILMSGTVQNSTDDKITAVVIKKSPGED
jgi:hypothetical protein